MQLVINIVYSFFIYLLIAKSFEIIYRTIGFFHLAHAISLTFGAYVVFAICLMFGGKLWIAIIFSVIMGLLLMYLANKLVYQPRQRHNLASWQLMIVSLGLYVVLQNVVSMVWGDSTQTFRTWEVTAGHHFGGGTITNIQMITIIGSVLLLLFVRLFCEKTKIGRRIAAVSSNPELSVVLGISHQKAVSWSIAIGSGLAACAGILIAADIDMTPTMGFDWLMCGVVAMIIGGMGRMRHLILGALLLASAQHLSAYFFDSKWMNATAYIILVVFLYFRPYGFSGKRIKKIEV